MVKRLSSIATKIESKTVLPRIPLYRRILSDHRKIERLFKMIENGNIQAYPKLSALLCSHMDAEEEVLYPILENLKRTHTLSVEAEEEHRMARLLIDELDSEDPHDERWMAKLKILKTNVVHHVKEEEGLLLPLAHNTLEEGEEDQLLYEFEKQRGLIY